MFVLPPPPPRFTNGTGPGPWGPGVTMPVIETNNTIGHPTGPEYEFSVGEGTYTLRDDIFLATPPPHPSEAPVINNNPLSTVIQPLVAGTKVSLVAIKYRNSPSHLYRNPSAVSQSKDNHEGSESRSSADTDDDSSVGKAASGSNGDGSHVVVDKFVCANASLSAKDPGRRKKPKNNIAKNNSSFVSRIIIHEHITKRLAERSSEGVFCFGNINRAFNWLDMDSSNKQEPLSKILFTKAHPICHNVNMLTRSASHIDVILGFSTADIMWFDPISNKYARINKNVKTTSNSEKGMINSHAVTDIKWLPGSENLFMASHQDGSLIVYDKEREDALFVPEDSPAANTDVNIAGRSPDPMAYFSVKKSVNSKNQKTNPVAYWSVTKRSINAFAFSPDCEHVAVVGEDHCLRVINFVKEKLLDVYQSYYGDLMCVCWSPDGRYILTGGQDDLVTIWSFAEKKIIARCEGHHSWVTSVAFDPWRCDDKTYRFGSVGNDCRLLLWDFSVGMLHKPKAASTQQQQHRGSMSSPTGHQGGFGRLRAESESSRLRSNSNVAVSEVEDINDAPMVHPVQPRARTAVLPPIMSKEIDPEPLTQLVFREDCIITTCVDGHLRTWDRPHVSQDGNGSEVTLSAADS